MKNQEKVWDEIAPLWNKYKVEKSEKKSRFIDNFIEKSDKKILDLGCGSGRNFFNFEGTIYAVDFSNEMLKLAEKNSKKFKSKFIFKKSKTDNLPFEDNFFDKVIFVATLHCIETEKEREQTIKELFRVLKPDGKMFITVWNKNSKRWKNKEKDILSSWDINGNKVIRKYYIYDEKELIRELEKFGFEIEEKFSSEKSRNIILIVKKSNRHN